MKKIIFFLFLSFISVTNFSIRASVDLQSQRLTTRDGLANNSVRHIYQDSKGFIWMGTLNGLNRYDGNSFITFLPQNDESISLADHRIKYLTEDNNGFLWISTSADLFSCYDLEKDCFVDFTGCGEYADYYGYIGIFPDEIWLWGRNQGCRRITYENGVFASEAFNIKNKNLHSNYIQFLKRHIDGSIWIGTRKGLYCWEDGVLKCINDADSFQWMADIDGSLFFLSSDGSIRRYNNNSLEKVATIPSVLSELDLPGEFVMEGEWYIFTSKGGYRFDPDNYTIKQAPPALNIPNGTVIKDNRDNFWVYNKTGKIHYIDIQTGEINAFQLIPQEKTGFIDSERYNIIHDSRDLIWISTYGNGLFTYDIHTGNLRHIQSDSGRAALIGSNFLQYIMQDRSGSIWVSSEYAGISLLRVVNEGAFRFYPEQGNNDEYPNRIRMLTTAPNGDIWLGTRNGEIYAYDSTLTIQKEKLTYKANIYAIGEDKTGTKWFGSRGAGLYVGQKNYMLNVKDSTSIASIEVFCILRDRKDRMWIGTFGGGLDLAIPDTEKGYIFRHFFQSTYGQRRIRTICEDRNGWIWLGTSEGIFIFNPDELVNDAEAYYTYNQNNSSLSSNEIRCIRQDSKGNIWIAETGTGFSICSAEQGYDQLKFVHYGVENGLTNSMVQAFVEDRDNRMWISTEYGISCFDPATETFENYFFSDNILDNVYSENCAIPLYNGNLLFGSNYGMVIIDPDEMERTPFEPVVTFTDLKLNGISVRNNPDSPLKKSLAYTEAIYLEHFQNSLIIDFSTLDYSNSIPPKFSYKLENYDKEWSIPSVLNFAAYKNLKPGVYNLHVKACNAAGIWGSEPAVLKVVISPPFWKTYWAYFIYLLLTGMLLYLIYRIIRNTNELQNKIKVEEQLTEYKLVFFTNISHEFRTPLTLIRGALEKLYQHKVPKDMLYSVKLMDKSTQRMLRLINQLLEFRKMQNNKLALSLEETDVIAFLYEIFLSFKDTAESKNMDFQFISSVPSYKLFIDKANLDKVAYNLISNAFKYTPSGGKVEVTITVEQKQQKLFLQVTDSGVGIPKEKQEQLFKRFMQSSFSNNSMGIGLHLTYELVNVHKGNISYKDNPAGGSVFTVVLSTDSSIYEKKDFLVPNNVLLQEEDITAKHLANFTFDDEDEENATNEVEEVAEVPLNKRKILVIEDDNDVRDFLKKELSIYFEVVAESDGNTGFERARIYDADLIISDVLMPGYSGFELTQKLKEDFETSHIPIILLTALNAQESHLEGIESGADAYITKPFSTKLLLTTVFKLIEQREKLREKFSNDLSVVRPTICTNDKDKEFMDRLTRIIEEQLENPEFTMDEFASMMALGRTVFYRKVQGVTGYTPKEYVRILRMKKAAELLIHTDDTVAEVAYKVGINDPFYFSKCFKSQFGVAPSVYQKEAKKVVK